MTKSLSDFFRVDLNAPFHNRMWSWGASNSTNVFLRAWRQDWRKQDGRHRILILGVTEKSTSPALSERLSHIKQIKDGKAGFVVVVYGETDPQTSAKSVKGYVDELFRIDYFETAADGSIWAVLVPNGRIRASELRGALLKAA